MLNNIEFTTALIKLALDGNFYGKRLRDRKLELVEGFRGALVIFFGNDTPEAGDLVDWLEANKPAKAATKREKQQDNRLAHDTELGGMVGHTEDIQQARGSCFILATAQNNTPICEDFLSALEVYADHIGGQILISGTEYNKTAYQKDAEGGVFYNPKIVKYMVDKPTRLYDNLIFAAELMINPTSARPTNMLQGYHGENGLIVPHVKIELKSYPTPQNQSPKFVWSTGTISQKNYIQRAAGQKAEAHHSIAALVCVPCKLSETGYQVRQLHWVNNSFIDLDLEVFKDSVFAAPPAHALSMGDIHAEKIDRTALANAISLALLVETENVFLHDLFDFESRNSHNREDHIFLAGMGDQSVVDDLQKVAEVLDQIDAALGGDGKIYIVRSNHDEQLDRWLHDPKYSFMKDRVNARLYLDLQSEMYGFIERGEKIPDMFELAMVAGNVTYPNNVQFLTRKSVIKIDGVMLTDHGDFGSNGSRGTPAQMAKTYNKATTGHTHSAGIIDSCYTSGVTGSKKMGYNEKGASSWSHAHTVQYANGSRAIIIY
jgi:hypothetical protein